jgi:hypothetical protein
MMGKGEKYELDELDKVLLRVPFWVDKITFILPILVIGLILGDNPLLLLEMQGFKEMKKEIKTLGKIKLQLIPRLPFPSLPVFSKTYVLFNYIPSTFKLNPGISSF